MLQGIHFLQVVEELDERYIGAIAEFLIYGLVGKSSKELKGIIIKRIGGDKKRTFYFSDIDRMAKILEDMSTE